MKDRLSRLWIFLGSLGGFLAIMAGVMGNHVFGPEFTPEQAMIYGMANHYQFIHALALIGAGLASYHLGPRGRICAHLAGAAFTAGILIFCGALYAFAIYGPGNPVHAAPPFGGICLMAGWLALAASAFSPKRPLDEEIPL